MRRHRTRLAAILGSLAVLSSLAPAPRASDEDANLKALTEARLALTRKIAEFYAEPRSVIADRQLTPTARAALPDEIRATIQLQDESEVWAKRLVDARIEVAATRDEKVAIYQQDLDRARANEVKLRALAENTVDFSKLVVFKAEYFRVEAEYRLAKEKAGR